MKVIYQGPLEAVAVEGAGVTAYKNGEAVDVPREVGESLLEQGWKKAPREQKAAKPDAAELSKES